MKNIDVVKDWYKKSWANPPASVTETDAVYLADDFKSYDENGNVMMNKEAMIGMTHLMFAAFKDFRAVYEDVREDGDAVLVTFHFEGTHTGDLDLSAMGFGVVPPSGKKIVWPQGVSKFMVKDGKIASDITVSGGMESFFEPLGIKLPKA
jgi:predicted ester cyclase